MTRRRLDPYTNERRAPMELLARLAGSTNYLVPTEGRSTAESRMTPLDVAHAIGSARDKFGSTVALAMACQRLADWPAVHQAGFPMLLARVDERSDIPGVVDGALRFRALIVLHDAFEDLVLPQRRRKWRVAIEESGVPDRAYRYLHREATALMEESANSASRDACTFLFAGDGLRALDESPSSRYALVLTSDRGGVRVWHSPDLARLGAAVGADLRGNDAAIAVLADLVRDASVAGRERTSGVLRLHGDLHAATYVVRP